ncbi:hypothetical protein HDR58_06480 [bacterium]|nr:hypothetical protein [bacterium]
METTQTEAMMRSMNIVNFSLSAEILAEESGIARPIQTLFDECLNFISVNDFNI